MRPVLVLLLALMIAASAVADPVVIRHGNRVRASLAADEGVRELSLPAAAGTRLKLKLRGDASLALLDPDGRPLAVSEARRTDKHRLVLDAIPATGNYRLLLGGTGEVRLKIRAKAPKKIRVRGDVTPGASTTLTFAAVAGSTVDVRLRGADGLRVDLPMAEVPGDGDVPLRPTFVGARAEVTGVPVPGLGDGTVVVTARDEDAGTFEGTIRVRTPVDRRTVDLPPSEDDGRVPGGDHLVVREGGGSLDDTPLTLRVRRSRVLLLRGHGPDGTPRERVDVVVEIESEAGVLVAWVLVSLRPEDLSPGSLSIRSPRIEMLHVVTNYRGLLYSTVVAPIDGPRDGTIRFHRGAAEPGREVEGVLDGEVERAKDGRRIELRGLQIHAVVEARDVSVPI